MLLALLLTSAQQTFKPDSKVARTYFIDEFKRAKPSMQQEKMHKDAIVTPASTHSVTAESKSLADITVERGQIVRKGDELATYKLEEMDDVVSRLESERQAYDKELSSLKSALATVQREERKSDKTQSHINSRQVSDNLNVNVELNIPPQSSPATARAIIEGNIAEATRQIDLIAAQISELKSRRGVISPADGVIESISDKSGFVTFKILNDERALRAYLTEKEWQLVNDGDEAIITIAEKPPVPEGEEVDKEDEEELTGSVGQKMLVPVDDKSAWFTAFKKNHKVKDANYYEAIIAPHMSLDETPFAAKSTVDIIINELDDALKLPSSWLVMREPVEVNVDEEFASDEDIAPEDTEPTVEEEDKEKLEPVPHTYYLDYDGRVRLELADVAFKYNKQTVFTAPIEDGTLLLNGTDRNEMARTFRTLPTDNFKKSVKHLKDLGWKDYIRYTLLTR